MVRWVTLIDHIQVIIMPSTLWCTPNIAIYRQILSIRVGYYELGCCLNSIHSKLWIIALNFDLFRSIIGAMVGCRWGCYGRLKRPPGYRGVGLHRYSRRVQRKVVLVRCYWLLVAWYRSDRLPWWNYGQNRAVLQLLRSRLQLSSAGVEFETTKLNWCRHGGMVPARSMKASTNRDQGVILTPPGGGIYLFSQPKLPQNTSSPWGFLSLEATYWIWIG